MNVQFFSFSFFVRPAALTLWNRWKDVFRKCAKSISIGNFPASRPNGSAARHRRRHRRAGSGHDGPAESEGRTGRVEPYGVRPSGPMAHRAAPWIADWRRRAGERAGETKNGTVPHGLPTVSSFASFRGVSAGRGRRTSGIDGADIGRGIARVKEYYRKKGNIVGDRPGGARCMGSAGRQGWKGTQDCVARRK